MYIITGATGHTGQHIAEGLLAAGHPVRVIGRSADRLAPLTAKGAEAAVGDLADAAFLTKAFEGAKAVYLVIPPKWDVTEWRTFQRSIIQSFLQALQTNKVEKAVLLSSIGAHMLEGAGPVSGLAELEKALETVPGLDVLNLRAGFFMENFLANIGLIKQAGIFGYVVNPDVKIAMVHTRDIAEVALKRLLALDFTGHSHAFVNGPADLTMPEAAAILGEAIGKPELAFVSFPPADARAGMVGAGMPETIADGYVELFQAMNKGAYYEGYVRNADNTTPTTLAWFAEQEFKPAFLG
jgi:uncharacterized protein YbjT (DUF2867 family)